MIHLWMYDDEGDYTKVDSYSSWNCYEEEDLASESAQKWADEYGESVYLHRYQGHESIEDGEMIGIVQPRPLQLALVGDAVVVEDREDDDINT